MTNEEHKKEIFKEVYKLAFEHQSKQYTESNHLVPDPSDYAIKQALKAVEAFEEQFEPVKKTYTNKNELEKIFNYFELELMFDQERDDFERPVNKIGDWGKISLFEKARWLRGYALKLSKNQLK